MIVNKKNKPNEQIKAQAIILHIKVYSNAKSESPKHHANKKVITLV
jgi:hypothetical protein